MSPQCKYLEAMIRAFQQDRSMAAVEKFLREVCAMAANKCPADDLIGLSLYVLEMGKKAGRDQAEAN